MPLHLGHAILLACSLSCGCARRADVALAGCPKMNETAVRLVPDRVLEARRVSGARDIQPARRDARAIGRSGRRVFAIVKLCLDDRGVPACIEFYRRSGYPEWDDRLVDGMRTWRYTPYLLNGQPQPVCAKITFLYVPAR